MFSGFPLKAGGLERIIVLAWPLLFSRNPLTPRAAAISQVFVMQFVTVQECGLMLLHGDGSGWSRRHMESGGLMPLWSSLPHLANHEL